MQQKHIWIPLGILLALMLALAACAETPAPAPEEPAEPAPAEEEAEAPPEPTAEEEAAPEPMAGTPLSDFEQVHIFTTATDVVGVGTYVAAEAYAVPAGEDPEAQPVQAIIMPYAIHPNMLVEDIEGFDASAQSYRIEIEGFTFEWSLEAPEGSSAELMESDGVVTWLADVDGQYVLSLTATDEAGNSGMTTWVVTTGTYVGVGTIGGAEPQIPQCGTCHAGQVAGWAETGHATFFPTAIDGEASDHYGPDCISCHTTGFNNRPEAVNGGFDDVAAALGWVFPAELVPGNWDALVADYPEVAALATIQCESCHGPGSAHYTGDVMDVGPIGSALDYGACAQCHAEEPYHVFPQQWEMSAHATQDAQAFWYPIGETRLACVQCHSGLGYIDAAAGVPMEERRSDYQVITCGVCHDPHSTANPNQLRVFDEVVLPDGTVVAEAGPAATCVTCHNSRLDPVASVEGESFSLPHYSTAGELLNGTGGYTWGETLPNSPHIRIEGTCITCHMATTPGMDDAGTPDDPSDDTPLPGHNTVGEHTFAMTSLVDGTQNVAACTECHGDLGSFEFEARSDYDGDGTVETNQEEVTGLLEVLQAALEARGVVALDHHPYFELPDGASADLRGAVFNLKFARDDASAVHNLRRTVALLQLSYERLTGSPVPDADIIPPE